MPHTPSDAVGICAHFKRNKCRHGISGRFPVGKHRECEAIHPQLCWQFLRYGQGKTGCPSGANCGHLHPRICQESWKTGKCDKGGLCGDGYHLGDRICKPKIKNNYGTPRGTTEGPRQFMIRDHGGSFGKQSKRMSGKATEIVLETEMTAKINQGSINLDKRTDKLFRQIVIKRKFSKKNYNTY